MSLTDGGVTATMPVAPAGYGSGYGSGFGGFGGDGWWIILILLFAMGGNWGNGFGGNNGTSDLALLAAMNNRGGTVEGYTQSNDFSNLERENDIIRQDICTNFANVNQTLANGFQGIQTSFANAELSRSNTQAALMQQMYNMSMADLQRGCDTQTAINTGFANTNYNLAQQGCDTRNTIQNTTRDVIDAQNAGTRAILDALTAQRIEQKDARITELETRNNMLALQASQQNQNAYLLQALRPYPIPAWPVVPPLTSSSTTTDTSTTA